MAGVKEIEKLTLSVLGEEFDYESLGRLVYVLRSLGELAPKRIAETVIDHPEFWASESPFSPRLAFGVVDHSIGVLDQGEQERLLAKFRRQVNLICLAMLEYERNTQHARPSALLDQFSDFFGKLRFAQTATFEVAHAQQLSPAELGALFEELVITTSLLPKLMERLLFRISALLNTGDKERLVTRASDTLERGFSTEPVDEATGPLLCANLDEVRFRKSFYDQEGYRHTARELEDMICSACGRTARPSTVFILQ